MDIKLLIFDFDGTIMDTQKPIVIAKQRAMKEMNLAVADEKTCISTIGLTSKLGFKKIYPELSSEKIDLCVKLYRKYFDEITENNTPQLFPNINQFLENISSTGIKCTIATSRNNKSLNDFLKKSKIDKYFCYTVGGEDTVKVKPNPEPALKIISELGISANQSMVIGDMPFDIQMGKGAGTFTCGVTYGNSDRKTLVESDADFVVDDIIELVDILRN